MLGVSASLLAAPPNQKLFGRSKPLPALVKVICDAVLGDEVLELEEVIRLCVDHKLRLVPAQSIY